MMKTQAKSELNYRAFLNRKSQLGGMSGFEPIWMPDKIKPFQRYLAEWDIRKGRGGCFAGTGLGKTIVQLTCAENVVRKTNRNVLVLTPLAVGPQTVREGEKFGIEAKHSRDGKTHGKITVTNYEQIHKFDPMDFAAVIPDEVACCKAFDGKRRKEVTRFMSKVQYRFGFTATPAPNDFIELGTIGELLGEMPQSEMLAIFFKASDNMRHSLFKEGDFWNRAKWFFRPHSKIPFWRWVSSWARACRRPSDLGDFDDSEYILPPLNIVQHIVKTDFRPPGELFVRIAKTLKEQRLERRRSMTERCEKMAELICTRNGSSIAWCQYNEEGDLLEKLIPNCVQVAGCDSDEAKEERLEAFALGQIPRLISKPRICSWGLNYQFCGHQAFFPSHSWEQWHQAIRRSWRFGRVGAVDVDIIASEGEAGVTENLRDKERRAEEMMDSLIREMNAGKGLTIDDKHTRKAVVPSWL